MRLDRRLEAEHLYRERIIGEMQAKDRALQQPAADPPSGRG